MSFILRTGNSVNIDILRFVINNYDIKAFLVIPNFNNPVGSCMNEQQKEELVNTINNSDIFLIEDDIRTFVDHLPLL